MFIKSISSYYIDKCGKTIKRTTNYGKYKDVSIAIESDSYKDKVITKQYILWTDNWQRIVNKMRNATGKFKTF